MKIVALMPVKNEEWILEFSAMVALRWCDSLVLLDHGSTDSTPAIIDALKISYGSRVTSLRREGAWAEMEHRQALLEEGRRVAGTHFALIDADEVITAELLPHARQLVELLEPGGCLDVPMLPIWRDLAHYRSDDCVWSRAMLTLAFCDEKSLQWRPREGYQHHHRAPFGIRTKGYPLRKYVPGVMHLQFAHWPRLRAKHALYKMQEVLRWPDRESISAVDWKYSQALNEEGLALMPCPPSWWAGYDKEIIDLKGEPWQRRECVRLLEQHGEKAFEGLELWGECQSV